MKTAQRFALGLMAGVGAAMAFARVARERFAISFDDRVVVITGGSRGLGLVMARLFAAEGARVVLLARDLAELDRARRDIEERGGRVLVIRCDIRRRADVRAAIDRIIDEYPDDRRAGQQRWRDSGRAARAHVGGRLRERERHAFPRTAQSYSRGRTIMRHRRFGRIVNIASFAGRVAVPHMAPYCASKFALVGLSDAVRGELDQHGIRVTTVSPGLMRTGSSRQAMFKGQHDLEFALFKTASSIPGITISAERAARKIVEACRYGDPALTLTPHAKAAAIANAVAPTMTARVWMLVSSVLPRGNGADGNVGRKGWELERHDDQSPAATLTDQAAVVNNEV